jgi:hypothetical protein
MTARTRITKPVLANAADVAIAKGVTITIEGPDGTTYRIAPEPAKLPLGASERDRAACDQAFWAGQ